MGKKCLDYINDLNDYIDGQIDSDLYQEIENHLKQCENCRIMIDTLKKTVSLCREGKELKELKLPPPLEKKLNDMLKKHWQEKFGK
ncbi:MAG: zf-HC2 domain-containing protein [FCB group bacterium]|nr:zf-HC2 domain-containing protein [FCB group bacterium]